MKALSGKVRLSRKFVLIIGGVLLLGGATGAAAVFIGPERLLGPSHKSLNGLECTTVQTVAIRQNGSLWIRQYIKVGKADGPARVKTALRVAHALHEKQKPDLVQVSVLDENGPQIRADMRGRAIGAQVVYIPDLEKAPEGVRAQTYSAYYLNGVPNAGGHYYGLRIDVPLEDVERYSAALQDIGDCGDPGALPTRADAHKASVDVKAPEPKLAADAEKEVHTLEMAPSEEPDQAGEPAADAGRGSIPAPHVDGLPEEDMPIAEKEKGPNGEKAGFSAPALLATGAVALNAADSPEPVIVMPAAGTGLAEEAHIPTEDDAELPLSASELARQKTALQ